MDPIAAAAIGSIIRWLLAILAGYAVSAGIWTDAEAANYVVAATSGIIALLWSLWQKRKFNLLYWTALESETDREVKYKMRTGSHAKPRKR